MEIVGYTSINVTGKDTLEITISHENQSISNVPMFISELDRLAQLAKKEAKKYE